MIFLARYTVELQERSNVMQDNEIVRLYLDRKETAIDETSKKYGRYLTKIAYNILADYNDSEESVNDTYLAAWNSIPPHEPSVLSSFLSKLTRRISISHLRTRKRKKRITTEYSLSLDELGECVSHQTPERQIDEKLLAEAVSTFISKLPRDTKDAFICRYYFFDSVRDTAAMLGISQSKLKSLLHRTRLELREHLQKEGFIDG